MSYLYSSQTLGDSVVTRVDWSSLTEAQREQVEARVREAHGAGCRTNTDGDRRTVECEDRYGCHVEGYLSRSVLAGVRS